LRYGIDVDGVLADFVGGFSTQIAEFGYTINPDSWGLGLTKEQEQTGWNMVTVNLNFWTGLDVLNQFPHERVKLTDVVYFITKRKQTPGRSTDRETALWLRDKQGIELPTVLAIPNKGEVCRALKVEAFIDDKPENCWDVMDESPATKVFLMNQPWNQWDTRVTRVHTLEEFFDRAQG